MLVNHAHCLFCLHYLRYSCLKVTRCYVSPLLHKLLPLSIRTISRHRKEKLLTFVILAFRILRLAEKFPNGSLGVVKCVKFPLVQTEHMAVYPLSQ